MQIDLDQLRTWIGRTETQSERLTPAAAQRFNATFDSEAVTEEGTEAPALIHFCLAPAAAPTHTLGEDGHPQRGGFLPPVPLPRRMWAGGAITFKDTLRIGEMVERRSTISDLVLKEGRSGTLCFVTVVHQIFANGRAVIEERQDIVYRGADPAGAVKKAAPPAPLGTDQAKVIPSAPLLFRYSALTFNGHRIHYDLPYARDVEGYPGLVVHGPLQATLLLQFATKLRGRRPDRFEFRSLSPLFNDAPFHLHAAQDDAGLHLWTARAGGPLAMEAHAIWNR